MFGLRKRIRLGSSLLRLQVDPLRFLNRTDCSLMKLNCAKDEISAVRKTPTAEKN